VIERRCHVAKGQEAFQGFQIQFLIFGEILIGLEDLVCWRRLSSDSFGSKFTFEEFISLVMTQIGRAGVSSALLKFLIFSFKVSMMDVVGLS